MTPALVTHHSSLITRHSSLMGIILPVLATLLLLVVLARMPLSDQAVHLDVGAETFRAPDETATVRRLAGFYKPEIADGISFRWTQAWARLIVPNARRLGEVIELRLRLCGCHLSGAQPTAQLLLDNRAIGALPTTATYRRYTVLVPPNTGEFGRDLFIELRTPTANFDGRPVGVRVDLLDVVAAPARAIPPAQLPIFAVVGALIAGVVGSDTWRVTRLPHSSLITRHSSLTTLVLLCGLIAGPALVLAVYQHQQLTPATLVCAELCGVLFVALAGPRRVIIALPLLVMVLFLPLLPQLLGTWVIDDAFISFRYAQQLVAGHGLVFNPSERVEGYTNFLWTIIIAAILRLGGDPTYWTQVLTLLIAQATVVLCYVVGNQGSVSSDERIVTSDKIASPITSHSSPNSRHSSLITRHSSLPLLAGPLLLVTSGPFLLYSARGSGLETALFTFLLLASVWAYETKRMAVCSALLALAAMTRPEGVLVMGVTAVSLLLRQRSVGTPHTAPRGQKRADLRLQPGPIPNRKSKINNLQFRSQQRVDFKLPTGTIKNLKLLVPFLLIFLPYYIWRFAYYGLPLPNTFYVKVGASWAQVQRGIAYLTSYWTAEGWAWALGLITILVICIVGRDKWGVTSEKNSSLITRHSSLVTPIILIYLAYIAFVGGDWLPEARFIVPLIPLLALLAQRGLLWLSNTGRWGATIAALLLALALFDQTRHTLTTSADDPTNLIWRENDVVDRRREVGRWLQINTPSGTLVAVEAAGALPYYSQRPAIDILGLNDRHIASVQVTTIGQGKAGHEKTDIPYVLARHPDIIPNFSVPYFADQPTFHRDYVQEEHDGPEGYTVVIYRRVASDK